MVCPLGTATDHRQVSVAMLTALGSHYKRRSPCAQDCSAKTTLIGLLLLWLWYFTWP